MKGMDWFESATFASWLPSPSVSWYEMMKLLLYSPPPEARSWPYIFVAFTPSRWSSHATRNLLVVIGSNPTAGKYECVVEASNFLDNRELCEISLSNRPYI